jgi:hypothetical protein
MKSTVLLLPIFATALGLPAAVVYETLYAENFGLNAPNHTDINGIFYQSFGNRSRAASANFYYANVVGQDQALYNTFLRTSTIGLNMSVPRMGGDFRLILKFVPGCVKTDCSFNMTLNYKHRILSDFNVYQAVQFVNRGYDQIIDFSICEDGRLWYEGESSPVVDAVVNLQVVSKQTVQISAVSLFRLVGPISKVCQDVRGPIVTTATTTTTTTTVAVTTSPRAPPEIPQLTNGNRFVADRNTFIFQFDWPSWLQNLDSSPPNGPDVKCKL